LKRGFSGLHIFRIISDNPPASRFYKNEETKKLWAKVENQKRLANSRLTLSAMTNVKRAKPPYPFDIAP
jgi:hypothetical protein